MGGAFWILPGFEPAVLLSTRLVVAIVCGPLGRFAKEPRKPDLFGSFYSAVDRPISIIGVWTNKV